MAEAGTNKTIYTFPKEFSETKDLEYKKINYDKKVKIGYGKFKVEIDPFCAAGAIYPRSLFMYFGDLPSHLRNEDLLLAAMTSKRRQVKYLDICIIHHRLHNKSATILKNSNQFSEFISARLFTCATIFKIFYSSAMIFLTRQKLFTILNV